MSAPPSFSAAEVRARLRAGGCESACAFAEPLARFLTLLAKWNRVYNLTGFRDPQQLLERVLLECLLLRAWLAGSRIADVGSGAGLPGLPLAITEPERAFTLIESRAKRVHFLRHVTGELGLANVTVERARAEDLPAGSGFDTVLARAVAPPANFLEIVRQLPRPGGRVVILTSPGKAASFEDAATAGPKDFMLREIVPLGRDGAFGVVVHLERIV